MEKNEIVFEFLKKEYLVSPDIFYSDNFDANKIITFLEENFNNKEKPILINKDILELLISFSSDFKWDEFNRARVLLEKGREKEEYFKFIKLIKKENNLEKVFPKDIEKTELVIKSSVKILKNYVKDENKIEIKDFVEYFRVRFKCLKEILQKRQELQDTISINKVWNKKENDKVVIIGIVINKTITKNGNFILDVEDLTGTLKLMVHKNNNEAYGICKDVILDDVLGITGNYSKNKEILFCKNILFPDIPLSKELKKSPDEVYVVCTSDIHVGSRLFYKEDFLSFIDWLNGNIGDEKQQGIAKKVKYVLITGDLVAGIGVYPNQEKDLTITDIFEQYKELANLLNKIRKDIFIVLCPGDHDAVRLNEPQPILDKEFSNCLYELENIILVTNPAWINLHSSENFFGFDFLLYHGHSFMYYADNVENIRSNGWTNRGDLIMKFLLQRRHLAPAYSSTLFLPDNRNDPLVIDIIPDFFVSGHLHQISNLVYRNVNLIGCGCWEGLTPYQEKTGSKADPAKVTLINLKTREIKILNFSNKLTEEAF